MAKLRGTIVNAWRDASAAWLAMQVDEGGAAGLVEYIVSIPFNQEMTPATEDQKAVLFRDLSAAAQQDALIDAVKAKRNAQIAPVEPLVMPRTVAL